MTLPDFLAAEDLGYVHVAGHRIGLHHVLRAYNEGYSPEMIVGRYPTLPPALVHKVIAFYLEHQAEVDVYVAAHDHEMERQMAHAKPGPTLAELLHRHD